MVLTQQMVVGGMVRSMITFDTAELLGGPYYYIALRRDQHGRWMRLLPNSYSVSYAVYQNNVR